MEHYLTNETLSFSNEVKDFRPASMWNDLLAQVTPATVASGILVTTNLWKDMLNNFRAEKANAAITPQQWLETDRLFKMSAVNAAEYDADSIAEKANEYLDKGIVPVFINDLQYDSLQDRWHAMLQKTMEAPLHAAFEVPELSSVTEQQHFFAASAMLHKDFDLFTPISGTHYGKQIKLVVPSSGYWNNTGKTIVSMELDAGDGVVLKMKPDEVVEHTFKNYGTQHFKITLKTSDDKKRSTKFTFANAEKAPKPDEHFALWADSKVVAEAWIYWATPNQGKINKPFLIAEGFPGGRGLDKLWPLVNQSDFVNSIRRTGRDFIILGFNNGTVSIPENAWHYRRAMEEIIKRKNNTEKIVAGGASMGGLSKICVM